MLTSQIERTANGWQIRIDHPECGSYWLLMLLNAEDAAKPRRVGLAVEGQLGIIASIERHFGLCEKLRVAAG